MDKLLSYSVLRYSPTLLSGERINLGILFSDESSSFHSFKATTNFARLKAFDDEIEIEDIKILLRDIEEDIKGEWYNKQFDIESYIKFYVNDIKFDKVEKIKYDDLDQMVNRLYKTYFRFDIKKSERPKKSEDKALLTEIIKSKYDVFKKNVSTIGQYDDNIVYDFVTDKYYIKMLDLDGKDLRKSIASAKTWAWNCEHENNKTVYIIYRCDNDVQRSSKEFETISKIFKDSRAQFVSVEESIGLL